MLLNENTDGGLPMHRFIVGDESVLGERDRAGVENAVSRTVAGWNVMAEVGLPDSHTIETLVWGVLTESQRRLLNDVIESDLTGSRTGPKWR
jgi:hypothetical protein